MRWHMEDEGNLCNSRAYAAESHGFALKTPIGRLHAKVTSRDIVDATPSQSIGTPYAIVQLQPSATQ